MQMMDFEKQHEFFVAIDNLNMVKMCLDQGIEVEDSLDFYLYNPDLSERMDFFNTLLKVRIDGELSLYGDEEHDEVYTYEVKHPIIKEIGVEKAFETLIGTLDDSYEDRMGCFEVKVSTEGEIILLSIETECYGYQQCVFFSNLVWSFEQMIMLRKQK